MKIIDKVLEDPTDTDFDIETLIHGSMKDKIPDLELAIDGFIRSIDGMVSRNMVLSFPFSVVKLR
ncbi:hypothetical protein QGM71_19335 [Virgibacillus sp. C22-A2]|uniref:Uncharacterized protein n=1 Tax=Virgibacillus tibetensis TaxID=3042313 RepID=A0ABU6KK06_9BACI|nr:hypothetical protein [Virgibacillus sp. C22-A2]